MHLPLLVDLDALDPLRARPLLDEGISEGMDEGSEDGAHSRSAARASSFSASWAYDSYKLPQLFDPLVPLPLLPPLRGALVDLEALDSLRARPRLQLAFPCALLVPLRRRPLASGPEATWRRSSCSSASCFCSSASCSSKRRRRRNFSSICTSCSRSTDARRAWTASCSCRRDGMYRSKRCDDRKAKIQRYYDLEGALVRGEGGYSSEEAGLCGRQYS